MLRDKLDRDREIDLARQIRTRSSRYLRGTKDQEYLLYDLEYIAPLADELLRRLNYRHTGNPYGIVEERDDDEEPSFVVYESFESGYRGPVLIEEMPVCCRIQARDIGERLGKDAGVVGSVNFRCNETGEKWIVRGRR